MSTATKEASKDSREQEPTSPLAPLAPFPNIQRSRATEFYGFATLIMTSVLFVLYHVWALTPDHLIEATGMTWYPSREWSLLIPAYTVIIILLTYFTYWGLALSATPSFEELRTLTDSHAYLPRHGKENPYVQQVNPDALPELFDIPIGLVNHVLFDSSDS
ncbi:hypothetical protein Clacol_009165 [Clathrus columnatus]|uniref:PIG-P domain-containing protein n=1 Tax=Clathrus columnatus TaxID=1419009 RepID=A0AAV5AKG4_9AGAM|nr:hypothetical protein Clacol_009165 [Clathrus columnatus]